MKTIAIALVTCLSLVVPVRAYAQHHTRANAHRGAADDVTDPASPADADGTPDDAATPADATTTPVPERPKSELALELVFHSHERSWGSEFNFSPMLRANIQLLDMLMVEGLWGLAYASQSPNLDPSAKSLRVGSFWLAGYFTHAFGKLRLRAGLGVTIPLASLPSTSDHNFVAAGLAYNGAAGTRGRFTPWMFAVHYVTVALPIARVDYPVTERLTTGAEAAAAYMIHYGDDDPMAESQLVLRLALWGAYTLVSTLQAGLRFQSVWFPTQSGDNAQLSLEPYARMTFGPVFARIGFVMNLDGPLGLFSDQTGYWGLRLEGGVSF